MQPSPSRRPLLWLLPLGWLGCADKEGDDSATGATSPCEEETRAQPLAVGSTFSGSQATLTVTAATPLPPTSGENEWTLTVSDATGTPLDDCALTATTAMPDHGHGGPVPTVTSTGDGSHVLQVSFTMGGYWEIDASLSCPATQTADNVLITVCAE